MPTSNIRHAYLFRNGRNQAIRIPKEFELPGKEVIIDKEGSRLIIEPIEKQNTFCTNIIVACELRYSALNKNSPNLTSKVELLLANISIAPLSDDVDRYYAELRTSSEKQGQLIGGNDMLIAAHALALRATLITANEREFLRLPGLSVENWLK